MANTMAYRGYTARIDYESGDEIFVGRLLGMNEPIVFHGASVEELRGDFEFAVDHYLAECEKMGQKPEKPASGKLLLRLPADTHAAIVIKAAGAGKSVNQWVSDTLAAAISE
ncbi:MAG: type II toxin-antitoxin system HicB family antitoxin [Betaproteobacteria bacterium]